MCHRRISMGLSQKELGNHLGVNSQQIQKYETDLNRVSAICLQEITKTPEVPVHFFTPDISKKEDLPTKENALHCDQNIYRKQDIYSEKELTPLKNFRELKPKKQKAILWLISN